MNGKVPGRACMQRAGRVGTGCGRPGKRSRELAPELRLAADA